MKIGILSETNHLMNINEYSAKRLSEKFEIIVENKNNLSEVMNCDIIFKISPLNSKQIKLLNNKSLLITLGYLSNNPIFLYELIKKNANVLCLECSEHANFIKLIETNKAKFACEYIKNLPIHNKIAILNESIACEYIKKQFDNVIVFDKEKAGYENLKEKIKDIDVLITTLNNFVHKTEHKITTTMINNISDKALIIDLQSDLGFCSAIINKPSTIKKPLLKFGKEKKIIAFESYIPLFNKDFYNDFYENLVEFLIKNIDVNNNLFVDVKNNKHLETGIVLMNGKILKHDILNSLKLKND